MQYLWCMVSIMVTFITMYKSMILFFNFSFKNELYLKRHVQRHSASEVKCPLCDKVAPSKSALGNHMRYMHVERSHKCSVCEKGFKRAIDLKVHFAERLKFACIHLLYLILFLFFPGAYGLTHRTRSVQLSLLYKDI